MSTQSVSDVILAVIQVEKDGAEFYRRLAGEVRDPAAKGAFLGLVNDEIQHQKDFQALARDVKQNLTSLDSPINLVEVLVSVTGKLKRIIKGSELVDMDDASLKNALDIGIHNELESIRVYSELLEIRHPGFAVVVQKIIDQEKKHLSLLEDMKAARPG